MDKKQKKIVKFNGGLGNQMFQYAFGSALADKYDADIYYDFSYFDDVKKLGSVTTRFFELGVFNLSCKDANTEAFSKITKPELGSKFKNSLAKLFPNLFKINYVREKYTYSYDKKFFKNPDYVFYEGYFQCEKYFKHIRTKLLEDFSLKETLDEKNQEVLSQIKNTNSVSIHIRRGDYVSLDYANKIHGTCSLEYYKKAIEKIASSVQNPHFYLFSDDIEWVIENLKIDYPYTVINFNQGKGHLDMELMKNCKHNIIANSSFSWWGAWLNENPNKIVIAPENWTVKRQKSDIIPSEWIRL